MDSAELRAQLEAEWTWRSTELRFLKNTLLGMALESDRVQFRRTLVVMMYAHFEGFCKAALIVYVDAINHEEVEVGNACLHLAAAGFSDVFKELSNPLSKNPVFRKSLPEDRKLHLLSRRVAFVEEVAELERKVVKISADSTVVTESNMKPVVLKKLLYTLGLDYSVVDQWQAEIDMLLEYRNGIAHGTIRAGIDAGKYDEIESAVEWLIRELTLMIFDSSRTARYLRTPPRAS